jgi:tape measure domain-containing protein
MGIVIDVESRAESAKRDLVEINKSLADLIRNSTKSNKSFGQFSPKEFNKVTKSVNDNAKAFVNLKQEGEGALNATAVAGKNLVGTLHGMRTAILSVGAAWATVKSIAGIGRLADDIIDVNNQLKLMTSNGNQIDNLRDKLYRLSRDTTFSMRESTASFVDFYNAISMSRNVNPDEILKVVKTINQALVLGGGTAADWSRVLDQIMNAMSQGQFTNVELRSMMRQSRFLSNMLMRDLNMNAGELRKFAEEGRFTADVFIASMERLHDQTQKLYDDTNWTIRESGGEAAKAIRYFFSEILHQMDTVPAISRKLIRIAEIFDTLAEELPIGVAFFIQKMRNQFRTLRENFSKLSAKEFIANFSLNLELEALTGEKLRQILDYAKRFSKALGKAFENVQELFNKDIGFVLLDKLGDLVQRIQSFFQRLRTALGVLSNGLTNAFKTVRNLFSKEEKVVDPNQYFMKVNYTEWLDHSDKAWAYVEKHLKRQNRNFFQNLVADLGETLLKFWESFSRILGDIRWLVISEFRKLQWAMILEFRKFRGLVTRVGNALRSVKNLFVDMKPSKDNLWLDTLRSFYEGSKLLATKIVGVFEGLFGNIRSVFLNTVSTLKKLLQVRQKQTLVKTDEFQPPAEYKKVVWGNEYWGIDIPAPKELTTSTSFFKTIVDFFKAITDEIASVSSTVLASETPFRTFFSAITAYSKIAFENILTGFQKFGTTLKAYAASITKFDFLTALVLTIGGTYLLFKSKILNKFILGLTFTKVAFGVFIIAMTSLALSFGKIFSNIMSNFEGERGGFGGFFKNLFGGISEGIATFSRRLSDGVEFINERIIAKTKSQLGSGIETIRDTIKSWAFGIVQLFVGLLLLRFGNFRFRMVGGAAILMFLDRIFDTQKAVAKVKDWFDTITGINEGSLANFTNFAIDLAAVFVESFSGTLIKGLAATFLLLRHGAFTGLLGGIFLLDIWKDMFAEGSLRRGLRETIKNTLGVDLKIGTKELSSTIRSMGEDLFDIGPSAKQWTLFGLFYNEKEENARINSAIDAFRDKWNIPKNIENTFFEGPLRPKEQVPKITFDQDVYKQLLKEPVNLDRFLVQLAENSINQSMLTAVELKLKSLTDAEEAIRATTFGSSEDSPEQIAALQKVFEDWKKGLKLTEELSRDSETFDKEVKAAMTAMTDTVVSTSGVNRIRMGIQQAFKEYGATITEGLGIAAELLPEGIDFLWNSVLDKIIDITRESENAFVKFVSSSKILDGMKNLREAFNWVTIGMGDMITTSTLIIGILAIFSTKIRGLIKWLITGKYAWNLFASAGSPRNFWNKGFFIGSMLGLGLLAATNDSISIWQSMVFTGLIGFFSTSFGRDIGLGILKSLVQGLAWVYSWVGKVTTNIGGKFASRISSMWTDPAVKAYQQARTLAVANANAQFAVDPLMQRAAQQGMMGLFMPNTPGIRFNDIRQQFEKIPQTMGEALRQSFSKIRSGFSLRAWLMGSPAEKTKMTSDLKRDLALTFDGLRNVQRTLPQAPRGMLLRAMGLSDRDLSGVRTSLHNVKRSFTNLEFGNAFRGMGVAATRWSSNFSKATRTILRDIRLLITGQQAWAQSTALKAAALGTVLGPMKLFAGGIKLIIGTLTMLWTVLWPLLLFGGIWSIFNVAKGGEGGLNDRLQYTIDQLKQMVGLSKDFTSVGGRRVDVLKTISSIPLQDFEGGQLYKDALQGLVLEIDISKTSQGQLRNLKRYFETFGELAQRASEETADHTRVLPDTEKQLKRRFDDLARYMGRLPQLTSQAGITEKLREDLALIRSTGVAASYLADINKTYAPYFIDKPYGQEEPSTPPVDVVGLARDSLMTDPTGQKRAYEGIRRFYSGAHKTISIGARTIRDSLLQSNVGIMTDIGAAFTRSLQDFPVLNQTRPWYDELLDINKAWDMQYDTFHKSLPPDLGWLNESAETIMANYRGIVADLAILDDEAMKDREIAVSSLRAIMAKLFEKDPSANPLAGLDDAEISKSWGVYTSKAVNETRRQMQRQTGGFFANLQVEYEKYTKINKLKADSIDFASDMLSAFGWDLNKDTGLGIVLEDRSYLKNLKTFKDEAITAIENTADTLEEKTRQIRIIFETTFRAETFKTWLDTSATMKGFSKAFSEALGGMLSEGEAFRNVNILREYGDALIILDGIMATSPSTAMADSIAAITRRILELSGNTPFFDEFSGRISKLGLPQINAQEFYFGAVSTEMQELSSDLVSLNKKFNELRFDPEADSVSVQEAQRQIFEREMDYIESAATARAAGLENMAAVAGESYANMRIAEQFLGIEITGKIKASKKLRDEYLGLWVAIGRAQALMFSTILTDAQKEAVQARIDVLRKQLEEMNSIATAKNPFSTMLSNLSAAGLPISEESFLVLGSGARNRLRGISEELNSISKIFSETETSDAFMENTVIAEIQKKVGLLKEARGLLIDSLHVTGELLGAAFGRLNFDNLYAVVNASDEELKKVLDLDKRREMARNEVDHFVFNDTNYDEYQRKVKDLLDLDALAERARSKFNNTLPNMISSINEMFKTSFEESDILIFGKDFFDGLYDVSEGIRLPLEEAMKKGTPEGIIAGFKEVQRAARSGKLFTFVKDLSTAIQEATTQGVKSSFDSIKEMLGFEFSMTDFLKVPKGLRNQVQKRNLQIIETVKAMDLENIDSTFVNDLITSLKTGNMDSVQTALEDFMTRTKDDVGGSVGDLSSDLLSLQQVINILTIANERLMADGLVNAASGADQLRLALASIDFNELDERARELLAVDQEKVARVLARSLRDYNLSSQMADRQKSLALGIVGRMRELNYAIRLAKEGGDFNAAAEMTSTLLLYQRSLTHVSDVVKHQAEAMYEAGEELQSAIESTVNDAFKGLLKGDKEEGKSYFRTFIDSILDGVTDGIIDTFANSVTDSLFGSFDSLFGGMIEKLGQSVWSMFGVTPPEAPSQERIEELLKKYEATGDQAGNAIYNELVGHRQIHLGILNAVNNFSTGSSFTFPESLKDSSTIPLTANSGVQKFDGTGMLNKGLEPIPTSIGHLEGTTEEVGDRQVDATVGSSMTLGKIFTQNFGMLAGGLMSLFGGGGTASKIGGLLTLISAGLSIYGGFKAMNSGGLVPGVGSTDNTLAYLTPGEFVVTKSQVKKFAPLLFAINENRIPRFASGGLVGATPSASSSSNSLSGYGSQQVINVNITGDISRQTKAEVYRMLPSIAAGVNTHNKERGYRG